MKFLRWLCCLALFSLLLNACGSRAPGPHSSERGLFTYWRIIDVSNPSYGNECSDSDTVRFGLELDKFEAHSLFLYKVSSDGTKATLQECTGIDKDSCSDHSKEIEFRIQGNKMTWSTTDRVKSTSYYPCKLDLTRSWELTDNGQGLLLSSTFSIKVVPTTLKECTLQEDDIRRRSKNKKGLNGCVVTQTMSADFYQVQ